MEVDTGVDFAFAAALEALLALPRKNWMLPETWLLEGAQETRNDSVSGRSIGGCAMVGVERTDGMSESERQPRRPATTAEPGQI